MRMANQYFALLFFVFCMCVCFFLLFLLLALLCILGTGKGNVEEAERLLKPYLARYPKVKSIIIQIGMIV